MLRSQVGISNYLASLLYSRSSGGPQLGTLLYLGKICNKVQQAISAPVAHG
jgi:hypothetical protein